MTNPLIGIVKKTIDSKVDIKKIMLFFKKNKGTIQLEELIPLLVPKDVVIINANVDAKTSKDSLAEEIRSNIQTLLPTSKVTVVEGTWKEGEIKPFYDGSDLTQLEIHTPSLGLIVSSGGVVYVYRSEYLAKEMTFSAGGLTAEQLNVILNTDLEEMYPTASMILPRELIKSGTKDISIWFSKDQDKEHSYAILHKLNKTFWLGNPQVNLHLIHHRSVQEILNAVAHKEESSQYVLIVGEQVMVRPVVDGVIGTVIGYLYLD